MFVIGFMLQMFILSVKMNGPKEFTNRYLTIFYYIYKGYTQVVSLIFAGFPTVFIFIFEYFQQSFRITTKLYLRKRYKDIIMHQIEYGYLDFVTKITISDSFSSDDVMDICEEIKYSRHRKNLFFLIVGNDINFHFSPEDIFNIVSLIDNYIVSNHIIHEAIVVSTPKEAAFSMLFNDAKSWNNKVSKIFSSEEVAIIWLKTFHKQICPV